MTLFLTAGCSIILKQNTAWRFRSRVKGADYTWKFVWNIDDTRYAITATLADKTGLTVDYEDTVVSERLRRNADSVLFSEFSKIYAKPAVKGGEGKLFYLGFTLGDGVDKVRKTGC